jgi:hypothetical protein
MVDFITILCISHHFVDFLKFFFSHHFVAESRECFFLAESRGNVAEGRCINIIYFVQRKPYKKKYDILCAAEAVHCGKQNCVFKR